MTPEQHQQDALRAIALAAVRARSRTTNMGVLLPGEGERLLCDVEHALASLIVLDAVPGRHHPHLPPPRELPRE